MSINDNNSIRTASTEAVMTQGPVVLIQEDLLCKWKNKGGIYFPIPSCFIAFIVLDAL